MILSTRINYNADLHNTAAYYTFWKSKATLLDKNNSHILIYIYLSPVFSSADMYESFQGNLTQ